MKAAGKQFATEAKLAAIVVSWLQRDGWQVWQEVDGQYDILAQCGPRLWAIETKLHLGVKVLAQALRRRQDAHWASVAVPRPSGHRDYDVEHLLERTAAMHGIGILQVTGPNGMRGALGGVDVRLAPVMTHRKSWPAVAKLRKRLETVPQDAVDAGTNRGGYWTPWKGTAERTQRFVRANPGCTLRELVDGIEHHYQRDSTARARLGELAEKGVIGGVRVEREGKRIRLYPAEESP